jgi:hypothetical protein
VRFFEAPTVIPNDQRRFVRPCDSYYLETRTDERRHAVRWDDSTVASRRPNRPSGKWAPSSKRSSSRREHTECFRRRTVHPCREAMRTGNNLATAPPNRRLQARVSS